MLGDGALRGVGAPSGAGAAGLYSGTVLATCVGLFLFTRILIPDVILTLAITLALWAFLRALEEDEPHPARWAMLMWAAMGTGLLLKGLIAAVFPGGGRRWSTLASPGSCSSREPGRGCGRSAGILLLLAIAAPWHVLATLRNPPYFDFTMHSESGLVPRVLLVLLHQRARAAVSEPALSARLQHRAAGLVLAVSPAVAVPVERVFPGGAEAELPPAGPGVDECG